MGIGGYRCDLRVSRKYDLGPGVCCVMATLHRVVDLVAPLACFLCPCAWTGRALEFASVVAVYPAGTAGGSVTAHAAHWSRLFTKATFCGATHTAVGPRLNTGATAFTSYRRPQLHLHRLPTRGHEQEGLGQAVVAHALPPRNSHRTRQCRASAKALCTPSACCGRSATQRRAASCWMSLVNIGIPNGRSTIGPQS